MTQPDRELLGDPVALLKALLVAMAGHSNSIDPRHVGSLEARFRQPVERFCDFLGLEVHVLGGMLVYPALLQYEQARYTRDTWAWMIGLYSVMEMPGQYFIFPRDLQAACRTALPAVSAVCQGFGIPVPESVQAALEATLKVAPIRPSPD